MWKEGTSHPTLPHNFVAEDGISLTTYSPTPLSRMGLNFTFLVFVINFGQVSSAKKEMRIISRIEISTSSPWNILFTTKLSCSAHLKLFEAVFIFSLDFEIAKWKFSRFY